MTEWKVYLNKKHIDTVFYNSNINHANIKESLINHDEYDPKIKVIKVRNK